MTIDKKSLINWVGGKRLLRKTIEPLIPKDIISYIEPLSYDDSPKVRELYKGFEMIEVERQNGINNRQGADRQNKTYKELLIANYPIKELHHAG